MPTPTLGVLDPWQVLLQGMGRVVAHECGHHREAIEMRTMSGLGRLPSLTLGLLLLGCMTLETSCSSRRLVCPKTAATGDDRCQDDLPRGDKNALGGMIRHAIHRVFLSQTNALAARAAKGGDCMAWSADPSERVNVLVLSGGGLKGAFGARVLAGWRARPRFTLVTGVSTGALQAPFVFLDSPKGDRLLRTAYRSAGSRDIVCPRPALSAIASDSLFDASGLRRLIDRFVTNDVIDDVATASDFDEAGRPSRLLLVASTNLDTGRTRIWNLSLLASRCAVEPELYERFRRILYASSAIPVFMPPQMLDGNMHVDGGAREQVFVPDVLRIAKEEIDALRVRVSEIKGDGDDASLMAGASDAAEQAALPHVYVIVNGSLGVHATCVQSNILDLATRSFDVLTDEALIGNLWRSYSTLRFATEPLECADCFNLLSLPLPALPANRSSLELSREDVRPL